MREKVRMAKTWDFLLKIDLPIFFVIFVLLSHIVSVTNKIDNAKSGTKNWIKKDPPKSGIILLLM